MRPGFFFMLFILLTAFWSFGQNSEIVVEKSEFKNLIGEKYTDYHNLGDGLELKCRSSSRNEFGFVYVISDFVFGDFQIIASEKITIDTETKNRIHEIKDIIVFKGYYATCMGKFKSDKNYFHIITFHKIGNACLKDSILTAFELNLVNGKFKEIDKTKLL